MTVLTSLWAMLWTAGTSREDDGQTMAEYGLILAGIAVVVLVAVTVLGNAITATFTSIAGNF